MTGDVMGARRMAEQLARASKDVASLRRYAAAAQAAHALVSGDVRRAVALYAAVLPEFPLRARVCYERTWTHYAQALNQAGEHAHAKAIALELISSMVDADRLHFLFLDAHRQLALAEAGLGNHREAVQILDGLIAEHGHQDNRLVIGLLHKARAEVALTMGDAVAFEAHASEMEQRFRSTRNPALIAQCERLIEHAAALGLRELEPMVVADAEALHVLRTARHAESKLDGQADARARALKLIMSRVSARSGYLYVRRQSAMHLAAASDDNAPPPALEKALSELGAAATPSTNTRSHTSPITGSGTSQALASSGTTTGGSAATVSSLGYTDDENDETQAIASEDVSSALSQLRSVERPDASSSHQLVLLEVRHGDGRIIVGGLILEAAARDVARLRSGLLRGVAQALFNAERRLSTTSSAVDPPHERLPK
jgi:hypothetical protein